MSIATEARRVNQQVGRMLWRDDYVSEVPLKLHNFGPDDGHGLGGPALSPQLIKWLTDQGVCFCEPKEVDGYMVLKHVCDRKRERDPRSVRGERFHARRISRALRQLRAVCYEEWRVVFPMLSRGQSWQQAMSTVNDSLAREGKDPLSERDILILAISGFAKIGMAY